MVKRLTKEQMSEIEAHGEVEYEPESREILQFGELIQKLSEMIENQAERTAADLARSKVQLEILATIQKTNRENSSRPNAPRETIDMTPLKDLLAELQQANVERSQVAYKFDIKRGEGGYMAGVIATPIQPTQH